MGKMKKIAACMAVGTGVIGISAKAVGDMRKKWFLRGFETGKLIGGMTAANSFAHDRTVIQQKYDKLCEEYRELENHYNEMIGAYDEDE